MKLKAPFFVLVMSVMNTACGAASWKEEVALHDGKTIVVKRSIRLGGVRREIGQGPGVSNETLDFTAPDGRAIHWEEPGHLHPLIFDFLSGMPYLATRPAMVTDYARYRCPNPAYIFFRYTNEWQRVDFKDFPSQIRETNLVVDTKGYGDHLIGRQASPAEIKELNSNLEKDDLTIDPHKPSPKGCEKTRFID
jgi:hypothetical protein